MFQLALAATVVLLSSASRSEVHDDLEPCAGFFTRDWPQDAYRTALRDALLVGPDDLACQMLAMPDFGEEWVVYLIREEVPMLDYQYEEPREHPFRPAIVFKRVKETLWYAMRDQLESKSEGAAPIERPPVEVDRFIVPVSEETEKLLHEVWDRMLARVQYSKESSAGRLHGVMYFAAHWGPDSYDERSGETWSPDEGTRTRAFVEIAEAMGDLARSVPVHRPAKEAALAAAARALLKRLELLDEPAGDR